MSFDAGRRRIAVTLLCLVISGIIFTSPMIFIDSYSQNVWDYETDVGPASMVIVGSEGLEYSNDILAMPQISKALSLKISVASVVAYPPEHNATLALSNSDFNNSNGFHPQVPVPEPILNQTIRVGVFDETLLDYSPSIINITSGRLPESDIEIAFADWLANLFVVEVGDIVSYEHGSNSPFYSLLRLVGIYAEDEADKRSGHYYALADAVIPPALMTNESREDYLFLEIDRSRCNPIMPSIGIEYLSEVEEKIRDIDPNYEFTHHTQFYIDDILAQGIVRYQTWLLDTRIEQLTRIQGFVFFALVFAGYGIRYNMKQKKPELEMLRARGATNTQISITAIRELAFLGGLSSVIAMGFGSLISKIGFVSSGFFHFGSLGNSPFLLTFDSVVLLLILNIVIPLGLYSVLHNDSKTVAAPSRSHGRLTRLSRFMQLFQWDITLSVVSLIILISIWESSSLIHQSPIFTLLAFGTPFTLFIGIAGLITRSLRTSSYWVSAKLRKPLGKLATGLGVRRISQNSSISGATILVVALAISLAWNGVVVDATLPNTILNQTKFAIGGDVTLRLQEDSRSLWTELAENVSENPIVEDLSFVTTYGLSLSSELQDLVEFVAINPSLYANVGYDSLGNPLNQSNLMRVLTELEQNPTGIVMTSDVAEAYGVSEGDTLRAFRSNGSEIETLIFNTLAVVRSLPDSMVGPNGYNPPSASYANVGRGRIWMNVEHADTIMFQNSSLATVLCIRTQKGTNGEDMVDGLLDSDVSDAILGYAIASVISDAASNQGPLIFNGSIDTLLVIIALSSIPVAFFVHFYEQLGDKRKEAALLRTIGLEPIKLNKYQVVEMQSVILYGILLIAVGSPILITNSLIVTMYTSTIAFRAFPSPILLSIPWLPLVVCVVYLVLCAGILGFVISFLTVNHNISKLARDTWADNWSKRGETE